jgi:hypothetical protein
VTLPCLAPIDGAEDGEPADDARNSAAEGDREMAIAR